MWERRRVTASTGQEYQCIMKYNNPPKFVTYNKSKLKMGQIAGSFRNRFFVESQRASAFPWGA